MARKSFWALAVLIPLAASTLTIAQQQPTNSPQAADYPPQTNSQQPGYGAQPAGSPQPQSHATVGNSPHSRSATWPEEQIEPYHKHHDMRHGHDHFYPDRGAVLRELPAGTIGLNYAGVSYRYNDGVWFEPRGPAFVVVDPPIGLVVPTLPSFATPVSSGGESYLYVNGIYYQARPDLGGYEVTNEPVSATTPPAFPVAAAAQAASPPMPASPAGYAATATALPVAAAVAAPSAAAAPVATVAAQPIGAATAGTTAVAGAMPAGTAAGFAAQPASAPVPTERIAMPLPNAPLPSTSNQIAPGATAGAFATQPAALPPPSSSFVAQPSSFVAQPAQAAIAAAPAVAAPATLGATRYSTAGNSQGIFPSLIPNNNQSADQQARDHYECYRFAVAQTGFDPMRYGGTPPADAMANYERSQRVCFEARGYAIR